MKPFSDRAHCRSAFTLAELLVVLGIIAVTMALLLPALQRVRDNAARAKCITNLRQIGLAAHQYHDTQGTFPAGMRWQKGTDPYMLMGWLPPLLPYLEQDDLWKKTQAAYKQIRVPFANPPHVALTTVMP